MNNKRQFILTTGLILQSDTKKSIFNHGGRTKLDLNREHIFNKKEKLIAEKMNYKMDMSIFDFCGTEEQIILKYLKYLISTISMTTPNDYIKNYKKLMAKYKFIFDKLENKKYDA